MLFYKGENETISAKRHKYGLSMGIYKSNSVVSLEYYKNKPVLFINRKACKDLGIRIIEVDEFAKN